MKTGNLHENIPPQLPDEIADCVLRTTALRIERIVSHGQQSDPDFWYDQDENEWVLLLKGEAGLQFAADNSILHLTPGAYVNIAAHEKHRVAWTVADAETIWLAVFY